MRDPGKISFYENERAIFRCIDLFNKINEVKSTLPLTSAVVFRLREQIDISKYAKFGSPKEGCKNIIFQSDILAMKHVNWTLNSISNKDHHIFQPITFLKTLKNN